MPSDEVPTEDAPTETPAADTPIDEAADAKAADAKSADAKSADAKAAGSAGDADAVDFPADADDAVADTAAESSETSYRDRRLTLATFVVLPIIAMAAALAVGVTKWQANSQQHAETAAIETVQIATEATVDMLSYESDTVEEDLSAVHDRLTDSFREEYRTLTDDVVIPGAREQQISTVATVPAAASMSADSDRAEVLVFVNQTVTIGSDPPTYTTSSVKVSLDRYDQRWLVSAFEPI